MLYGSVGRVGIRSVGAGEAGPTPDGDGLVWGSGNYLVWDANNFLIWSVVASSEVTWDAALDTYTQTLYSGAGV